MNIAKTRSVFSNIFTAALSTIVTPLIRLFTAPGKTPAPVKEPARQDRELGRKRTITNSNTFTFQDHTYPINTHEGIFTCRTDILEAGISQLTAMLSHHSRVLAVRVDLHLTKYEEHNERISELIRQLRKHLKHTYKMKRFGYMWVREQEKAKSQHYHLALFLDGNKVQYPSKLLRWIKDRWTWYEQPKPPTIGTPFQMTKRQCKSSINDAVYRISYLAKPRGKGYRNRFTKDYSSSRIKAKES